MVKIRTLRYQAAQAYIARCLVDLRPGEKLPSIRELIDASGTTRAAVTQALDFFQKSNVIQVRPSSGIVKLPAPGSAHRVIDLVCCGVIRYSVDSSSGIINYFISAMGETLSRMNYAMRVHVVHPEESAAAYVKLAQVEDSSGFILLKPQMESIVKCFSETGKPTVSVFPQSEWSCGCQVRDPQNIVELLMEHLIALGHTRIAMLHSRINENFNYFLFNRLRTYYRIMATNGFRVQPHWQGMFDDEEDSLARTLEGYFSGEPRPSALIVPDRYLFLVYKFLGDHHLLVGRDVAVAAIDGLPVCDQIHPRATTTVNPFHDAVDHVRAMLKKQLKGDFTPERFVLQAVLKPGGSTFPWRPPEKDA